MISESWMCPSEGGDKAFIYISRDHMINESCDSVGEISSTWINWGKLVLQIGATLLYYKLGQMLLQIGQLHYYKLGQVLL